MTIAVAFFSSLVSLTICSRQNIAAMTRLARARANRASKSNQLVVQSVDAHNHSAQNISFKMSTAHHSLSLTTNATKKASMGDFGRSPDSEQSSASASSQMNQLWWGILIGLVSAWCCCCFALPGMMKDSEDGDADKSGFAGDYTAEPDTPKTSLQGKTTSLTRKCKNSLKNATHIFTGKRSDPLEI
mmetsp:Transcript_49533/g.78438  ORF Transcript_49533/g.78438 Transcript_49533/m.78438 type:complete len:187 (+) Transcript_49533:43-603(+)